jgi:hypothetical protein
VKKTTKESHPDPEQIRRFVQGEASPAENRELVRHLIHGCTECQKVVRKHWSEETRGLTVGVAPLGAPASLPAL